MKLLSFFLLLASGLFSQTTEYLLYKIPVWKSTTELGKVFSEVGTLTQEGLWIKFIDYGGFTKAVVPIALKLDVFTDNFTTIIEDNVPLADTYGNIIIYILDDGTEVYAYVDHCDERINLHPEKLIILFEKKSTDSITKISAVGFAGAEEILPMNLLNLEKCTGSLVLQNWIAVLTKEALKMEPYLRFNGKE